MVNVQTFSYHSWTSSEIWKTVFELIENMNTATSKYLEGFCRLAFILKIFTKNVYLDTHMGENVGTLGRMIIQCHAKNGHENF